MNIYRIRYKKGVQGAKIVRADSVNGFKPEADTYVFKIEDEVVAVIPKVNVASVTKTGSYEDSTTE